MRIRKKWLTDQKKTLPFADEGIVAILLEQPMVNRHLNRYALSFVLGVLCNGCIMYVPDWLHLNARESKAETFLPSIIPGQTTKEEVYRMLGEPDGYSWNRNELVYRWKKLKFLLLLPFGYSDFGVVTARRKYMLLISLDERGVIVEKKLEEDLGWKQGLRGLWQKDE